MSESKKQREAREAAEAAAAAAAQGGTTEETTEEEDPLAGLSDEGAQPFVDDLLNQANDLEAEKTALYERIQANRETLRTIAKTGMLSEKQAAAILLWYPVRAKKEAATV